MSLWLLVVCWPFPFILTWMISIRNTVLMSQPASGYFKEAWCRVMRRSHLSQSKVKTLLKRRHLWSWAWLSVMIVLGGIWRAFEGSWVASTNRREPSHMNNFFSKSITPTRFISHLPSHTMKFQLSHEQYPYLIPLYWLLSKCSDYGAIIPII